MTYEEKIANFQNCQKMSTHRSKKPYKSSINKLKKNRIWKHEHSIDKSKG